MVADAAEIRANILEQIQRRQRRPSVAWKLTPVAQREWLYNVIASGHSITSKRIFDQQCAEDVDAVLAAVRGKRS